MWCILISSDSSRLPGMEHALTRASSGMDRKLERTEVSSPSICLSRVQTESPGVVRKGEILTFDEASEMKGR